MDHHLEVADENLEGFVLCLALGTLEAMSSGHWPLDAGIWTLARPVFWEDLVEAGLNAEVIKILQSADELSVMEKLSSREKAEAILDQMIGVVRRRLAALPDRTWYARWTDQRSGI